MPTTSLKRILGTPPLFLATPLVIQGMHAQVTEASNIINYSHILAPLYGFKFSRAPTLELPFWIPTTMLSFKVAVMITELISRKEVKHVTIRVVYYRSSLHGISVGIRILILLTAALV